MKRIGLLVLLSSVGAFAAPSIETSLPDRDFAEAIRPRISLGVSVNGYDYVEEKMRENSGHRGLIAKIATPSERSVIQLATEYEFFNGDGTYHGQTWGGKPLQTGTKNESHVVKSTVGIRHFLSDTVTLSPFAGLGFRFLVNEDDGPGSYRREIRALFLPIGFEWTAKPADRWKIGFTIEADAFLAGSTISFLSESDPSMPDLENEQRYGSGSRLSTEVSYAFNDFTLSVRPFVQVWNIEDSDRVTLDTTRDLVEPRNSTRIIGTDVIVTF